MYTVQGALDRLHRLLLMSGYRHLVISIFAVHFAKQHRMKYWNILAQSSTAVQVVFLTAFHLAKYATRLKATVYRMNLLRISVRIVHMRYSST